MRVLRRRKRESRETLSVLLWSTPAMTAIVDFEDALHRAQKALQCPICLETMAIPTLTKCGHRFCSRCLDELLKRKKQSGAACPLCKQPVSKRSLAKQTKFESIVKVVEKLADAFQEDLVNPINADWCGADTLERDLSEGYGGSLLGTGLGRLPAAQQQQQPVPAECNPLPVEVVHCGNDGSSSHISSKTHTLVMASGLGELDRTTDSRSCSEIRVVAADAVEGSTGAVDDLPSSHVAAPTSLMSEGISCGGTLAAAAATLDIVAKIFPPAVQTEHDVAFVARRTVADEQMVAPVTGELAVAFTDLTADGGNKWPIDRADTVSSPQPAVPPPMVPSNGDSDSVIVVPDDEVVCLSRHRRGDCDEADDSARPSHDAEPSVMVVDSESATSNYLPLIVASCVPAAIKATPVADQPPAELQSEASDRCAPRAGTSALAIVAAPSSSTDRLASPLTQPYVNPPSDCRQQSGKKIEASSDDTALESQPAATAMVCEDSCPEDMEMGDDVAFEEALISSNQALGITVAPPSAAPLVMTGCSLSLQDAEEAQRLARLHSGRYQTTFTSAVTHVLVRTLDEDEGRPTGELPAKVYLGTAAGCHIVTVSWIYDSLQRGALLPEVSYRVRSAMSHECCVKHSTLSVPQSPVIMPSCHTPPSLLATWEVCCGSPCRRFSPDELHDLIVLCGARKVRHPSSFSYRPGSSRVILLDMEQAKKDNSEIYARFGHLYASPVADYDWLLTCIINGRPFIPEKGCTMGCSLPGCTELWNRANVPALFTGS